MNDESLNFGVRKFLKKFGVSAQREMEKAVSEGLASGKLKGTETLKARATVTLSGLPLNLVIEEDIPLA